MTTCGYVTHEKGASKIKGHKSLDSAVQHAKKASKTTAVVRICKGKAVVIARCANGGCGGSLSGTRSKKRRTRRARRR